MKPLKNKKIKNLIIILAITVILSGMLPNYIYAATDTANGGGILEPIEQFVVYLCDEVMQWMQNMFTSKERIEQSNGEYNYNFQYSPAIIFSGDVPALDINFIDPNKDRSYVIDFESFVLEKKDEYYQNSVKYESEYLFEATPENNYTSPSSEDYAKVLEILLRKS